MAATSRACGFPIGLAAAAAVTGRAVMRRRRISPEAGHALEILGHAIEYLTDEFVCTGGSVSAHDAQVEAVQLLMSLNREIYFGCPEVRTVGDRFRALLHPHTA
ncbi:MAG: hypothetical protein P4K93_00175 [Terracidiphilus sp.]|nr:hypothetical protein [Terracidiphilus sp.]